MSAVATVSDIALLRRYADDRDESAFAEIVRRYAGMVYAACYRVLQDKQLAEDVTQETFLKLMRRPGHVSLSLGGWLHKAATQLAIDVSRSESARRRRERVHSQDHVEFLEDQKSWKEISETIDRAMTELPEEARDLLVQHFILGRCQKDIAEERSVSVATICRRVNDAMEQLRGVLRRRGMSMGAMLVVFDFLALRGSETIPLAVQQGLGKMVLLAGVKRGWTMVKPMHRVRLNFWQVKELELAAAVLIGAMLLVLGLILLRGKAKPESKETMPAPQTHASAVHIQSSGARTTYC
jgi:RNA polymerase sigma factor (sigma-70 family)